MRKHKITTRLHNYEIKDENNTKHLELEQPGEFVGNEEITIDVTKNYANEILRISKDIQAENDRATKIRIKTSEVGEKGKISLKYFN